MIITYQEDRYQEPLQSGVHSPGHHQRLSCDVTRLVRGQEAHCSTHLGWSPEPPKGNSFENLLCYVIILSQGGRKLSSGKELNCKAHHVETGRLT